ncbi:MAG: hypothetical protein K9W44_10490 [Candidatus Lokiarchaeota archaeon]|nr:hypothetical protein [Candidatus Harpocratesius repetitus]
MAHLYLADQKKTRELSIQQITHKKKTPNKQSVRDKKAEQSWGDTMGGILRIIKWIDRYKIYRLGKFRSMSALNAWGHLLGKLVFGSSSKIQRRVKVSLRALYPNASPKAIHTMFNTHVKYMGMLLMDIIFRLPFLCDYPPGEQVKELNYINFERLEKVLEKGKGAIVLILHLGEHFHNPLGVFIHPKKYNMSVVASIKNLPMYEFNNRPHFDNLYIYASTKFAKISKILQKNLTNNHALVMYHDYSSKTQLKVPFIAGKLPFLINTPQSYIRLHRLTGAEILPLITVPEGVFGKSKLFFLDNTSIKKVSEKYWNAPSEEFHGRMSTEINRIMYPWVRKYAPWWEELMRLAGMRSKDELKIPANITLEEFLTTIKGKMQSVISGSWEPDRQDEQILQKIENAFQSAFEKIKSPKSIFRPHKSVIRLSLMTGMEELQKMAKIVQQECRKKGELELESIFAKLSEEFKALTP